MSDVQDSHEMPVENSNRCQECGAELRGGETLNAQSPGTPTCQACGTPLGSAPINPPVVGNLPVASPPPRGRNPMALVVVAVIVAGMLYFGFHMARRNGSEDADTIMKQRVAPNFTLETLDGKSLSLSDLRGKAVLLNFWATWCGPCKIETPWLVEMQNEYGSQGLQVVGVAMDDSGKDEISKFAKDMGVNYPVLIGKESVGDAYGGVPALPESFFIGRDGKIIDKIIGLKGRAEIEDSVKRVLKTQLNARGNNGILPAMAGNLHPPVSSASTPAQN